MVFVGCEERSFSFSSGINAFLCTGKGHQLLFWSGEDGEEKTIIYSTSEEAGT